MEKLLIREAAVGDAPALLDIYRPYVEKTAITFEYQAPTAEEFAGRIAGTLLRCPYLAAERGGKLLGYAYASPFKERAAYAWAVETSIYVREDCRGQGVGRTLYAALEEALRRQRVLNLNACIAYPNPESIAFHERLGYRTVAHFHKCGFKLGKWWDMVWMEKFLGEHPNPPGEFLPYSKLQKG